MISLKFALQRTALLSLFMMIKIYNRNTKILEICIYIYSNFSDDVLKIRFIKDFHFSLFMTMKTYNRNKKIFKRKYTKFVSTSFLD